VADVLSAAEAVLDAAYKRMDENPRNEVEAVLAAALRAAADQLTPEHYSCYSGHGEWDLGMDAKNDEIREEILAIAAELEGNND
jgi:hypothetical protein